MISYRPAGFLNNPRWGSRATQLSSERRSGRLLFVLLDDVGLPLLVASKSLYIRSLPGR